MTALLHAGSMTGRHLRVLLRQPWYIAFTLVQPMLYLLIFGALFERVVEIPGFAGGASYIAFLTPGVVIMSALFSSFWNGLATLEDLNRGTLDRFPVAPVWRGALIVGPVAQGAVTVAVQSLIIFLVGVLRGAEYARGMVGLAALVTAAVLLAVPFAAFSHAVALTARSQEAMIGAVNFIALPATFLSSAFLPVDLAPGWLQAIATFNPVNWAVEASRAALSSGTDWGLVLARLGALAAIAAAMGTVATSAFRAYQRNA